MIRNLIIKILILTFFFSCIGPLPEAEAQTMINLPAPGSMIPPSERFKPLELKGIQIYQDNPLRFDFLVDKGQSALSGQELQDEITRVTKYFLTCLTVPEKDLWVNLSPFEKDRIAPDSFGVTEMGKNLLEQDYLLKQIMASMSYPENELGRQFWQKVYTKAQELYGSTHLPVNTFNKVWIVPKSAKVYVRGNGAFVVDGKLEVMLEEDYVALNKDNRFQAMPAGRQVSPSMLPSELVTKAKAPQGNSQPTSKLGSQIIREIILPQLRKEINEGKNFAVVRQVYHSMILATWYKRHLKDSLLSKMYVGQNKIVGVDVEDKEIKEKIFQQYLKAYKKGVYNYIREDYDPLTQTTVPRKYASGGMDFALFGLHGNDYTETYSSQGISLGTDLAMATVDVAATASNGKILRFPDARTYSNTHPFNQVSYKGQTATDQTMISRQMRSFLPKLVLGVMLALPGLGINHSVQAASYTPGPNSTVTVTVQKGDTASGIVKQMQGAYKQFNPQQYQKSAFAGTLWGEHGAVKRILGPKADRLTPGQKIQVLASFPAEAVKLLPHTGIAVSQPAVKSSQGIPVPPGAQKLNQTSSTKLAEPVSVAQPQVQSPLPSAPMGQSILQKSKEGSQWTWAIGIAAVAGLAGVMIGRLWGKINSNSNVSASSRNSTKMPFSAPPAPAAPSGTGVQHNKNSGFEVLDNSIPVPDADELAWIQQMEKKNGKFPLPSQFPTSSQRLPAAAKKNLNDMDIFGFISALGLAVFYLTPGGGNLGEMATQLLVSPLVTRLFYGAYKFLHEIGHTLWALGQAPKRANEILTWRNIFANYGAKDWLQLLIPFAPLPDKKTGVDLPFSGPIRRNNQKAGFVISAVLSGLLGFVAFKSLLCPVLLGPMAMATIALLKSSWWTDIRRPSNQGNVECGDSGVMWLPNAPKAQEQGVRAFFPSFVRTGLKSMRRISGLRGDQGEGVFTWGQTSDGDIVPLGDKVLKDKRGKEVVEAAHEAFEGELSAAVEEGIEPLGGTREVITHDRFLTQGTPSRDGLHPHLGPREKRTICFFDNGEYQRRERTVVSVVIENGDNDNHRKHGKFMPTKKIREFYPRKFRMKKTYYNPATPQREAYWDYLPSGDAPALAVQMQWYDNQGDPTAAMRFALDEVMYQSPEESMEHNLSQEEENILGDFYWGVWEDFEGILTRPQLKREDKNLKHCWVTHEMAEQYPSLGFQYKTIRDFKKELKNRLMQEVDSGSEVGQVISRVHQLHPDKDVAEKIDRMIDMAVERFFTADTLEAVRQIDELTENSGQYGVRVLNSKAPYEGVFWTDGQSIALGQNKGEGYVAYNSEHTALMESFGEAKGVEEILFLDSESGGQLTQVRMDPKTRRFGINAYSVAQRKFLTQAELDEWTMQLTEDNKYFTPPVQRERETSTEQDVDETAKAIEGATVRWKDKQSFVRQTGGDVLDKMVARAVEFYIKDNSTYYRVSQGTLLQLLYSRAEQCGTAQCAPAEAYRRRAELIRAVEGDSRVIGYLRSRLDQFVAYEADTFAEQIINKKKTEDDLLPLVMELDGTQTKQGRLSEFLDQEATRLVEGLLYNNTGFLTQWEQEEGQRKKDQGDLDKMYQGVVTREDFKSVGLNWEEVTQILLDYDLADRFGQDEIQLKEDVLNHKTKLGEVLGDDRFNRFAVILNHFQAVAVGEGLPKNQSVGAGEAVLFVTGLEDSLWIGGDNLKDMLKDFFPKMPIRTGSSNKTLDRRPGDDNDKGVGKRTLVFVVSKSGGTSPSKNAVPVLKRISDEIYAWTGTVNTLLGLSLGQRYYKGAPFSKRIFPTGNYYPSEINTVSEVELLVNQIEFVLHTVKRMKEIFPHYRPWGMNVTEENIRKLEEWRDKMVAKATALTGVDPQGNKVQSKRHQGIVTNARVFGKMITETPIVNMLFRGFVFGVFMWGAPVKALALYLEHKTGIPLASAPPAHLMTAVLDTTVACSMQWWLTTLVYRSFSGRLQRWGRMGPPKVLIGDVPVLNQVEEIEGSKRSALAIGSMDVDYHGGNAQDHLGARFIHRVRRGGIEIFGTPEDPHALSHVMMTMGQSNVRNDMSFGWKLWDSTFGRLFAGGPEIFSLGHGDVDLNLTHHHMNIGELETVTVKDGERKARPDVPENVARFYAHSFEILDRMIAYKVFFNESYRYATQWGRWRIWVQETLSKTKVLSTPSPRSGPRAKMPNYEDDGKRYGDKMMSSKVIETLSDKALVNNKTPKKGGIDMNSQFMDLQVSGHADMAQLITLEGKELGHVSISSLAPRVSNIVPITPSMLQEILTR